MVQKLDYICTSFSNEANDLNPATMMVPVSISLSTMVLKVKGVKSLVSFTFIANFGGGREKFLNKQEWVLTNLDSRYEASEVVNTSLDYNCTLFYRDWSNVPNMGKWDKDYPAMKPTIPSEITSLIKAQ